MQKTLGAIVAGVLLAGPPMVALNLWLHGLVERQIQEELDNSARRTIALAEARLARVTAALDDLASRGVDSCRPANLEALRQTTFAVTPIKELSVITADGRTLCSDFGALFEQRKLLSSERLAETGDILIETVRLGERTMVRIRRPGSGSANGLGALISPEGFIAQLSSRGAPLAAATRMTTRAGALIAESGAPSSASDGRDDHVVANLTSQRHGFSVTASLPRAVANASSTLGDLRALGLIVTAGLAIVLLGCCTVFSAFMPKPQRNNPIAEIERALRAGEFIPYYQPIVDIRSGRLRGAEVLMRWRKPDGTVLSPAAFIPLAESSGLIVDLTRALMRKACQEAGPAFGRRQHLKLGFNLTARHFSDEEIVRDVSAIFGESPIRMSQVVLEVTERQPLGNLTETRRVVAALQGLGARIAIDDVGTGHSGLSYMLKLGVDIIKIDKMFIDSIGTDRNSNTIIETLIDLAQNMRMDIIAEGVETFEQVIHLRELGIRAAQGYVFSPPLPGSAFLQLVEAIDPLKEAAESGDNGPPVTLPRPLSRFAS